MRDFKIYISFVDFLSIFTLWWYISIDFNWTRTNNESRKKNFNQFSFYATSMMQSFQTICSISFRYIEFLIEFNVLIFITISFFYSCYRCAFMKTIFIFVSFSSKLFSLLFFHFSLLNMSSSSFMIEFALVFFAKLFRRKLCLLSLALKLATRFISRERE